MNNWKANKLINKYDNKNELYPVIKEIIKDYIYQLYFAEEMKEIQSWFECGNRPRYCTKIDNGDGHKAYYVSYPVMRKKDWSQNITEICPTCGEFRKPPIDKYGKEHKAYGIQKEYGCVEYKYYNYAYCKCESFWNWVATQ